ncbi:MAG: class I SAM-dependent methyltransferase [Burkholderiales bacterium]|nr:class I SAM-dependent methyltransferase [Anaerolineae bacterium]
MKLYNELALWWPLVSSPAEYVEEVAFFLPLLAEITARPSPLLLELGSGGGNNALHMKSSFSMVTLVDLSPQMLEVSQVLNPECEHLPGDMRTVRLKRMFDAVFIHDAIDYMTTIEDLRQAMTTAFVHCIPGGMVLLVPDHVRETFEPMTDHGGEDGEGRSVRFLEWSYDHKETDSTYVTDYVVVLREDNQPVTVEYDQHIIGLFALDEWLSLLRETGFEADYVVDPYERYVFVARKP